MSDTMMKALSDAWDAQMVTEEAPEVEAEAPAEAADDTPPEPEAEAPAPDAEESPSPADVRPRDEAGKFTAKPKAPPAPKSSAKGGPSGAQAAPAPAKGAAPAPTSGDQPPDTWHPIAKEHWAATPRPVKDAVLKMRGDASRAMNQSAEARKVAEGFERTIAPYRPLITGEPLQVVEGLLRTATQLQTAPVAHKGALIAQIIKTYGIPVEAVADALDGKAPAAPAHAPPAEFRDPRFDAFLEQQKQREAATLNAEIDRFWASAEDRELLEPVMVGLIKSGAARGETVAARLKSAYDMATYAHPEVRGRAEQRRAQEQQAKQAESVKRAKVAGSSVVSQPARPVSGKPATILDEMSQRWDELSQR